jgi:hypothetical protein
MARVYHVALPLSSLLQIEGRRLRRAAECVVDTGHSAAIAIDTLEVLAGSLPRRTLAMVLEWASLHRDELRADWELCRRQERPTRIAPLE